MKKKTKIISIVVSVYNEEKVLNLFYDETSAILKNCCWDYELIFVDDGSQDASITILKALAQQDPHVKVISFSRNFGHEAAMIAGIDYSTGDGIVCMDADLQHPPALIDNIIEQFEQGYEIVNMIRTQNKDAGFIKNLTSSLFYKILNFMSSAKFENNASDFFAIAKKPAQILKNEYRERMRFLRGYVQIIGFKKTAITYVANERKAGESKYNLKKLLSFSINALTSFSDFPLKLGIYSGLFVGLCGFILMIYTLYSRYKLNTPTGYATIIVAMCFMFSLLFVLIGIIGQYISILFTEVKGRPIYTVEEAINTDIEDP